MLTPGNPEGTPPAPAGDPSAETPPAVAAAFEEHGHAVFRYVLHMLRGDAGATGRATVVVWARVVQEIGGVGPDAVRPWLFRLASEAVRTAARPVPGRAPAREPSDPVSALSQVVMGLPRPQRAVWWLHEIELFPPAEIAGLLNADPRAVRADLRAARAALTGSIAVVRDGSGDPRGIPFDAIVLPSSAGKVSAGPARITGTPGDGSLAAHPHAVDDPDAPSPLPRAGRLRDR